MNRFFAIIVLFLCVYSARVQAQPAVRVEFEKFVHRFPMRTWMDLDSLRRLRPEDMEVGDSIPIDMANRNMYYDKNERNDYNHVKRGKVTTNHPDWGELPPPLIRNINGNYRHAHGGFGLFFAQRGMRYEVERGDFVPSDEYSKVYPLGRIECCDDVVVLVLLYKYMPELTFVYSIDVYTYTKSDQQMCSAMTIGGECTVSDLVFSEDFSVSFKDWYEIGFGDGGSSTYAHANEKFILSPDGYLSEIFVEWPQCGYIVDPDGYVNMRKSPDVKSEVVATISSDSFVVCYPVNGTKWLRVWKFIDMKNEVYRSDCEGYIHMSRFEDQYEYESKRGW